MSASIITPLIESIVKSLVDNPDAIHIEERAGDRMIVITIASDKSDTGKIIGRNGTIITALRTIFKNVAAKHKKRVDINVLD